MNTTQRATCGLMVGTLALLHAGCGRIGFEKPASPPLDQLAVVPEALCHPGGTVCVNSTGPAGSTIVVTANPAAAVSGLDVTATYPSTSSVCFEVSADVTLAVGHKMEGHALFTEERMVRIVPSNGRVIPLSAPAGCSGATPTWPPITFSADPLINVCSARVPTRTTVTHAGVGPVALTPGVTHGDFNGTLLDGRWTIVPAYTLPLNPQENPCRSTEVEGNDPSSLPRGRIDVEAQCGACP